VAGWRGSVQFVGATSTTNISGAKKVGNQPRGKGRKKRAARFRSKTSGAKLGAHFPAATPTRCGVRPSGWVTDPAGSDKRGKG